MQKTRPARGKKILQNKHTGRLRHHRHTSYGSLLLVLLLASSTMLFTQHTVSAEEITQTGSTQAFAVVPAPTYKNAPTITSIQDGQTFQTIDPITVSGSCPGSSLVEVYRDDAMVGAALCSGGSYQIKMTLFRGANTLIARAYNSNNVASPDSVPVTVKLGTSGKSPLANNVDFYITADQTYQAAKTGEPLSWQLTINGGLAPYAVSVDWGDGKTDLYSRTAAGTYGLSHAYSDAASTGHYTAVVRATDQQGKTVYLQLVAIVRGPVQAATTTQSNSSSGGGVSRSTIMQMGWTAIGGATVATLGFWLGEVRETRLLGQGLRKA